MEGRCGLLDLVDAAPRQGRARRFSLTMDWASGFPAGRGHVKQGRIPPRLGARPVAQEAAASSTSGPTSLTGFHSGENPIAGRFGSLRLEDTRGL